MPTVTITITLDKQVLERIDHWVAAGEFSSRSRVVQAAIAALQEHRVGLRMLLKELANLDPAEERTLADERLAAETMWPA